LAMEPKYRADKTPIAEIGAVTSGNLRFDKWKEFKSSYGRNPSVQELDAFIDNTFEWGEALRAPYGTQIGTLQKALDRQIAYDEMRRAALLNSIRMSYYKKLPFHKRMFVPKPKLDPVPSAHSWMDDTDKYKNAWKDAIKNIGGYIIPGIIGYGAYESSQSNETDNTL
jgi:hypothetical protein